MISIGLPFPANPNLPERFAKDAPLNAPDPATVYGDGDGEHGYPNYPFFSA